MWTSVESPVGPLRVIAHHDAVTAIEFDGPRQSGLPKLSAALVRRQGRSPGAGPSGGGP